jgi:hypothetical protein
MVLWYGDAVQGNTQKRFSHCRKKVVRYIVGLKPTDSCWESFISLHILTLFYLCICETFLFKNEKGNCIMNDKFHSPNAKPNLNYYQYVHKLGIHSSRPTIAGGKYYNILPAYIRQIKDN